MPNERGWYLDSSGSAVNYPQVYQLSDDDIEAANTLHSYIIECQTTIETSFLKLGMALNVSIDILYEPIIEPILETLEVFWFDA